MADFNPLAPEVSIPSQTQASRGIGTSRVFSSLFGGIADTASTYLKYRDDQIKNDIYEDTRAQVDSVQKPYIDAMAAEQTSPDKTPTGVTVREDPNSPAGGARAAAGDIPAGPPPDGLQAGVKRLSALQNALNSGTIRDSYYHIQLDNIVGGLRSKYPGYNQVIDATIQNITGITPANALVTDFYQEATKNASAAAEAAKSWQTYVNSKEANIAVAIPDYFQNPAKYDTPQGHAFVQSQVALIEANDANNERFDKSIARKKAMGEDTAEDAYSAANRQATSLASIAFNTANNGGMLADFQKAIADPASMTPEKISQYQAAAAQLLNIQRQNVEKLLTKPLNDQGDTYTSLIKDQGKLDQIRQAALQPIMDVQDALNNKAYGAAYFAANYNQLRLDDDTKRLLDKSPGMRSLQVLNAIGGQAASEMAMSTGSPLYGAVNEELRQSMNVVAAAGEGGSINYTIERYKEDIKTGKIDKNVITSHIDNSMQIITNPQAHPDVVRNEIEYMFGPEAQAMLENFPKDQQTRVWNKLVNPAVTEKVFQATRSQPDLWTVYTRWAANNFTTLFQQSGADVQAAIANRPYLSVSWNPETVQFSVSIDPNNPITKQMQHTDASGNPIGRFTQTARNFLSLTPYDAAEGLLTAQAQRAVRDMNIQLAGLKSVIDHNGLDANVEIMKYLRAVGVNPNSPKVGNFFDQLGAAISKYRDYIFGKSASLYGSSPAAPEEDTR